MFAHESLQFLHHFEGALESHKHGFTSITFMLIEQFFLNQSTCQLSVALLAHWSE